MGSGFVLLLLTLVVTFGISGIHCNIDGVCPRFVQQTHYKKITKLESFVETYRKPNCHLFRCKRNRISYRTVEDYVPVTTQTEEFRCCSGYMEVGYKRCHPICTTPCQNSTCIAPNKCSCLPGYEAINPHSCKPICDPPCGIASSCSGPNECTCDPGYLLKVTFEHCHIHCGVFCNMECDIIKGEPVCPCRPAPKSCHPYCIKPCHNGFCSAPGVCACFDGYQPDELFSNECNPVCPNGCINGGCIEPDTCSCFEGFILKNGSKHECEPFCKETCVNGKCTEPNVCTCDPGFKQFGSTCMPICDNGCLNGFCVEPNVCLCDPGYRAKDDECQPSCEEECINANCTAPNFCTCQEGYQKSANDSHICEPICHQTCMNGVCVAPDECACDLGYIETDQECEPFCSNECINANCTSPDMCTCMEGYEPSDLQNICNPACVNPCINGTCIAPDTCACDNGYQQDDHENGTCVPICQDGCFNATCTEPDVCTCFDGFIESNEPNTCQLEEYSTTSEVFECEDGFVFNDTTCIASCSGCENGTCEAPEQCICDDGFILDDENNCIEDTMRGDKWSLDQVDILKNESLERASWLYPVIICSTIAILAILTSFIYYYHKRKHHLEVLSREQRQESELNPAFGAEEEEIDDDGILNVNF